MAVLVAPRTGAKVRTGTSPPAAYVNRPAPAWFTDAVERLLPPAV